MFRCAKATLKVVEWSDGYEDCQDFGLGYDVFLDGENDARE